MDCLCARTATETIFAHARRKKLIVGVIDMRVLVVIPARGGSRAIKNKNLAPVGGKLLINWTLELLPTLDLPDYTAVVSTDSKHIADHCEWWFYTRKTTNCSVLKRPAYLAADNSTTLATLQHAIIEMDKLGYHCDAVLCLQPTNPLRTVQDISAAHRIMEKTGCDSVASYHETTWRDKSLLAVIRKSTGHVAHHEGNAWERRQEFRKCYKRTGEIYLTKRETIEAGSMTGDDCRAYIIPRCRAWNIDEPCDIPIVEGLLRFNGRL